MQYVGDGFAVDAAAYTVERDGEPVELEPQAMDLLLFMLERRDQLLTKAELLDGVWGDQFVGDGALATRVKQLRQALGDDGKAQRIIQTVHGKGYKFVAPISSPAAAAEREPSPSDEPSHNIPPARTALIGRRDLLTDVQRAMERARLVTLLGLGGAGKTSVAQAVGRRCVDGFQDGVWFVDLIPARDADTVLRAVARAIGLQLGPTAERADLLDRLASRELCLILDNCEHVVEAAASFCGDALDAIPGLTILATSREPLRVRGEHRVPVGPLPVVAVDADDGGAIDLLTAIADRYGSSIAGAEAAAIELCQRVDGLPLAIELVGARLATLSVREVVDRLERFTSADAAGERRDDRHSSLSVVLADTLDGVPRQTVVMLRLLAHIEGEFSTDDAEAIGPHGGVDDSLDRLIELVDRSLVATATVDGERRYRVLEMVRQHLEATDPEPHRTADAHAGWCLSGVGEPLQDHFYDLRRASWVAERFDDLVVAHTHLTSAGRTVDAASLVAATGLAMHLDDGSRAARILALLEGHAGTIDDQAIASRLHCTGVMTAMAARVPEGMYRHGLAAVEMADQTDDASLQAFARVMRSWAGVVIDIEGALRDLEDAIVLAESVGDGDTALMATGYKVLHLAMALRFDEAVELGDRALSGDLGQTSYPRRVVSTGMISILLVADPERALAIDDGVRSGSGLASFWGTAIVRAAILGRLERLDELHESLDTLEARLDRAGISPLPDILLVPAMVAMTRGEDDRASRYLGALRASAEPTQSLMVSTAYRVLRSHVTPAAAESIGSDAADTWREARDWLASLR